MPLIILWAAMFKQMRLLSGDEQGRMFGSLEGARGLFEAIPDCRELYSATRVLGTAIGMVSIIG